VRKRKKKEEETASPWGAEALQLLNGTEKEGKKKERGAKARERPCMLPV